MRLFLVVLALVTLVTAPLLIWGDAIACSFIDQPKGRLPLVLESRSDFTDSTARDPGAPGQKR